MNRIGRRNRGMVGNSDGLPMSAFGYKQTLSLGPCYVRFRGESRRPDFRFGATKITFICPGYPLAEHFGELGLALAAVEDGLEQRCGRFLLRRRPERRREQGGGGVKKVARPKNID